MAEKAKFQAIKGVRDILPPESALWNRVEQTAREVFGTFGFAEIRLPIFEPTELFARSVGEETDIVSKEMFSFWDPFDIRLRPEIAIEEAKLRGMNVSSLDDLGTIKLGAAFQQLSLRPEATATVVRAYIEHGIHTLPGNVKLYYMGPMFRRERPQKGRYRQFYQIGAEVLGTSDAPGIDAEVIEMLMTLFERLKLKGAILNINSIGDKNCRPAYVDKLRAELQKVREQLGPDSQRRIETNPLRVLDSKLEHEQPIIEKLPRISDYLDEPCRKHFEEVQEILQAVGVPYTLNNRLVRGLDYYTRTAFEFTHGALGAQNAILGGGRYDGLSEALGGPRAPGIGFAIGEDRLVLALSESAEALSCRPDVYIAPLGAGMNREAARLARELRRHDVIVELGDEGFRLKKSLELASRMNARFALIVGENEVKSDTFALKNLATGEQVSVARTQLPARIQKIG